MSPAVLPPLLATDPMTDPFHKNQSKAKQTLSSFPDSILPCPSESLNAAWKQLPNKILPTSCTADGVFLRAPPPTPVAATFAADEMTQLCDSSSCSRDDDQGSLLIYETESASAGVLAFELSHLLDTLCAPTGNIRNSCALDIPEGERRTPDDAVCVDFSQGHDSVSSVSGSDTTSLSSRGEDIASPSYLQEMVDSGMAEISSHGIEAFVNSILALVSEADSPKATALAAMCAIVVIKQTSRVSFTQGQDITKAIRVAALENFRQHWRPDGDWISNVSAVPQYTLYNLPGVHKAGFMGSLFDVKVVTAEDVVLCLQLLLEGGQHFHRLCAMHAIISRANDKLCKRRNVLALMEFEEPLTLKDPVSGRYVWAPTPCDQAVLEDIVKIIERWRGIQAVKRERYPATYMGRHIPAEAVGPRLRSYMKRSTSYVAQFRSGA